MNGAGWRELELKINKLDNFCYVLWIAEERLA
jgi:hypothetical protein